MEPRTRPPGWAAALAGVTAGAVALGIAQLVAGVFGGTSPIIAVGNSAVDNTPLWLKEWAIRTFGENDKNVLIGGILVVVALLAAALGVLSRRRVGFGVAGLWLFGLVGMVAVLTGAEAGPLAILPPLIGAGAGAMTLSSLFRRLEPPPWAESERAEVLAAAKTDDSHAAAESDDAHAAAEHDDSHAATERDDSEKPEMPPVMRAGSELHAFSRRRLLTGVGVGVGVAGVSGIAGQLLSGRNDVSGARTAVAKALPTAATPLPPLPAGVEFKIPNLSPFSTPNHDFYRVDTALVVPAVDPKSWTLKIHGMVDKPIEITFDDLIKRPLMEADVTLTCVSNEVNGPYVGNARWLGVRMADVLREAGLQANADMLLSTSSDGWTCGTPIDIVMDGRDALFAIAMNGEVLPVSHGFPVRQVVPGLYGYVSATKWVTDIKVTRYDLDEAYWTPRGWSAMGPIKTGSRIDVPRNKVKPGRNTIAGVAWAQHRGIEKVEVQVDDGDWRVARLAEVPGPDTWRQWAIDWDFTPGLHTIRCRATDGTGQTQTANGAPPAPNGATGYPTVLMEAV
ncbi:molybdopterin-dependent oxidoreductase [Acrocarpospora sp. B8E8]|uniref:molybdopterin-dependent oxidoreductase n=1 Tax=Acrocarpospora sp. B8E8 TaxID=3153572 RepID=UPI00325EF68B